MSEGEIKSLPQRDDRGRLLPGNTSNPGGQSRAVVEFRRLLESDLPRAHTRLLQLIEGDDARAAVGALTLLLQYTLGKPKTNDSDIDKVNLYLKDLFATLREKLSEADYQQLMRQIAARR